MTNLEAIDQLQDLIADRNSLMHLDGDNEVYEQDIQALQIAIAALTKNQKEGVRMIIKFLIAAVIMAVVMWCCVRINYDEGAV